MDTKSIERWRKFRSQPLLAGFSSRSLKNSRWDEKIVYVVQRNGVKSTHIHVSVQLPIIHFWADFYFSWSIFLKKHIFKKRTYTSTISWCFPWGYISETYNSIKQVCRQTKSHTLFIFVNMPFINCSICKGLGLIIINDRLRDSIVVECPPRLREVVNSITGSAAKPKAKK